MPEGDGFNSALRLTVGTSSVSLATGGHISQPVRRGYGAPIARSCVRRSYTQSLCFFRWPYRANLPWGDRVGATPINRVFNRSTRRTALWTAHALLGREHPRRCCTGTSPVARLRPPPLEPPCRGSEATRMGVQCISKEEELALRANLMVGGARFTGYRQRSYSGNNNPLEPGLRASYGLPDARLAFTCVQICPFRREPPTHSREFVPQLIVGRRGCWATRIVTNQPRTIGLQLLAKF
jgi:hypothetical protein